jgi:hypothetical protein
VSSITDGGVGIYGVNLTNALADANYSVTANCMNPGVAYGICSTEAALNTRADVYTFGTSAPNTPADMSKVSVAIFR